MGFESPIAGQYNNGMEILNNLPEDKYLEIDDFLAFLGVYEDRKRLGAFERAMKKFRAKVVVEAGAGLGELAEVLLRTLQPEKLYLIEDNRPAYEYLKRRFGGRSDVEVVKGLIEEWEAPRNVDLLVQEFYGPLLYDESLEALSRLKFTPQEVFPNRGFLRYQVIDLESLDEPVIDRNIWHIFDNVLVSDLFWYFEDYRPQGTVLEWRYPELLRYDVDLSGLQGDVLILAVEVWHDEKKLCDPASCLNWPFVFTPRLGDRFRLDFSYKDGFTEVFFQWTG